MLLCVGFISILFSTTAFAEGKLFVDSDEYKDKEFVAGIIKDYSDMVEGNDIGWIWVDSSIKLSKCKIKLGKFENKSAMRKKSLAESVDKVFKDAFGDLLDNESKTTLITKNAIYYAESANIGKAWIPFVGMHKAQAAIGVEMVFNDEKGRTVAKVRHEAREGMEIDKAIEEAANDLVKFILKN
jgi:hypothetical protein